MGAIRFDDKHKRAKKDDGSYANKLVHIREVFNIFTWNTQNNYNLGKVLTVDEILLPFQGRCSFRMFIPSKAAKHGIKIFCAADPETMYVVNASVYLGNRGGGPERDLGEKVVMDLTRNFLSKGLTIVTYNFFTSSQLGRTLWNNRTYLLGTIRKNRQGNPKEFVKKPLELGKIKFPYRMNETLMMFQARSTKRVLLYSTKHHQPEVGGNGKPKMINDYNDTKFGVDIFDKICGNHSYAPPVQRWPLRLFMHLCDAAALNAYVLFKKTPERRSFIIELADQLMEEQKQRRREANQWTTEKFSQIDGIYKSIQQKVTGQEEATTVLNKKQKRVQEARQRNEYSALQQMRPAYLQRAHNTPFGLPNL